MIEWILNQTGDATAWIVAPISFLAGVWSLLA